VIKASIVPLPARFPRLPGRITIIFGRKASTATAASSGSPTAATRAGTTPRTTAVGFGSSLVHSQSAATNFFSVQFCHCLGGIFVLCHLHKGESTRLPRLTIIHNVDASDLTEWLEESPQIRFRGLKAHIANEQILHI
jgi:hypothetical protein